MTMEAWPLAHAISVMTCGRHRMMNQRVVLTEMQKETGYGIVRSVHKSTNTARCMLLNIFIPII